MNEINSDRFRIRSNSASPTRSASSSPSPRHPSPEKEAILIENWTDQEQLITDWIETILNEERPPSLPFLDWVRDGVVLCEVMNLYFPGTIRKINRSPVAHTQIQNLQNYLKACKAQSITPRFTPDDLYTEGNFPLVRANISSLFQYCSPRHIPGLTIEEPAVSSDFRLQELISWIWSTLLLSTDAAPIMANRTQPTADEEFFAVFGDGVLLCHLMNALKPQTIPKIHTISSLADDAQSRSIFKAIDNIESYLLACRTAFRLSAQECFVPTQLTEKRDIRHVYHNLFVLWGKVKHGAETSPPSKRKFPKLRSPSSSNIPIRIRPGPSSPLSKSPSPSRHHLHPSATQEVTELSSSAPTNRRMRSSSSSPRPSSKSPKKSSHSYNTWKLQYPVHYLARKGKIDQIKQFSSPSLTTPDHRGRLPIHCAAAEDQLEVVQYLVASAPASLLARDESMDTPLTAACAVGAFTTAKWLLLNGADATDANNSLATPLHLMASLHSSRDRDSLCKTLLRHGANINARNQYGETAVMLAAAELSLGTLKFLYKRKADFSLINQFGETCLHKACRQLETSPRLSRNAIALLLEYGVNPNVAGTHGSALALVSASKTPDVYQQLLAAMLKADRQLMPSSSTPSSSNSPDMRRDYRASRSLEHLQKSAVHLDAMQKIQEIALLRGEDEEKLGSDTSELGSSPHSSPSHFDSWAENIGDAVVAPPSPLCTSRMMPPPEVKTALITDIISPCDGYIVEQNTELSRQKPAAYKMNCGYLRLPPSPYRNEFFGKIHTNYIGMTTAGKPFVASILDNAVPRGADEVLSYCALIKTPNLEKLFWIPHPSGSKSAKTAQLVLIELFKMFGISQFHDSLFCRLPSDRSQSQIQLLETQDPIRSSCFPIGIVYAKDGQTSQWDMWNNQEGSPAYDRFLRLMGNTISLRGWSGYSGGLDVQGDSKGKYSLFTTFEDINIMYHVSTMLPYDPKDPHKLQRSRVICNDVAMIIFQDGSLTSYIPSTMTGQVSHVFLIVRPIQLTDGSPAYQVGACYKDYVTSFGPRIPTPNIVLEKDIRQWLLTKILNGFIAAQMSPGLSMMYVRPRQHLMTELNQTLADNQNQFFSLKYDKAADRASIKPTSKKFSSQSTKQK